MVGINMPRETKQVTCTCGRVFEVDYVYEEDYWNAGHYGQRGGVRCCEKYSGYCGSCYKNYEEVMEELKKEEEEFKKWGGRL